MATIMSLVATIVSGVFAAALLRRYLVRGRANPALAYWGASLSMFCVASGALAVGAVAGWDPATFRVFYLFGAVLNVPWLAGGSTVVNAPSRAVSRITGAAALVTGLLFVPGAIGAPGLYAAGAVLGVVWGALLLGADRDGVAAGTSALLGVFTAVATLAVLSAGLVRPLPTTGLPEGRDLFTATVRGFAVGGNAVGAVIVIVSAVAAAVALVWGRPPRGAWALAREDAAWGPTDIVARWLLSGRRGAVRVAHLVRGNLLIALGVVVAAAGGAFSFLGETTGHAVGLAVGVTIMFLGFVRTTRPLDQEPPLGRPVVDVYTRVGCGLCRRAEQRVAVEAIGAEVRLIDVDTDPALAARYGVRVPVVVVDGVEVAELELAPGRVRDAVRQARRGRVEVPTP